MPFPNIPDMKSEIHLDTCDSLNVILASIGFEELALAQILSAEGEKIQSVLGTLRGMCPERVCIEDLLRINDSVVKTIESVSKKEEVLVRKLDATLCALKDNDCDKKHRKD